MLPTKIFRESPFKALKILGAILGGVLLFFVIIIVSDEMPQITSAGLNKSATLVVIIVGVFSGFMLLTFLILSFQHRKTLKCDFAGCEIQIANFWSIHGVQEQFKWSEVIDTNITENDYDTSEGFVSVYSFVVETANGEKSLLELKTSSNNNIEGLIKYVNEATPQLKYVWIKDSRIGNRQVIKSHYGYSKVAKA